MTHVLISTLHRKFSSENLYKYIFAFVLKDTYCPTMQCTDMEVQLRCIQENNKWIIIIWCKYIFLYLKHRWSTFVSIAVSRKW